MNKNAQPEKDTELRDILAGIAGNISRRDMAAYVPHAHGSGDVHHFVVDHGEGRFYVALGTTTDDGTEFVRKACDAPVLAFDMEADVLTMPSPVQVV